MFDDINFADDEGGEGANRHDDGIVDVPSGQVNHCTIRALNESAVSISWDRTDMVYSLYMHTDTSKTVLVKARGLKDTEQPGPGVDLEILAFNVRLEYFISDRHVRCVLRGANVDEVLAAARAAFLELNPEFIPGFARLMS